MRASQAALLLSIAVVATAWSASVRAETKQQCLTAYDKAQTLLQSSKLVAARKQLLICVKPECPGFVADDCGKWLSDADVRTPTIVIDARNPEGLDAVDVTVEVDGRLFMTKIDGHARPLDPGEHVFKFQMDGARPIERRVVIHEAVKGRRIAVVFEPLVSATPVATPPPSSPAAETAAPDKGGVGASVFALGALGLVGMGAFTYFGLDYDRRLNDLDACKPHCDVSRTDRANVSRNLAFVSGGVGVVALGTAVTLLATGSGQQQDDDSAFIDLSPVAGGAMGVYWRRF